MLCIFPTSIPYDCKGEGTFLKHKGIYGFTLESLRRYCGFLRENLKAGKS